MTCGNLKQVRCYGLDRSLKWVFDTVGDCFSSPAVGDLNGDGVVEIVLRTYDYEEWGYCLFVLDGGSGTLRWFQILPYASLGWAMGYTPPGAAPALGDLDGDDRLEIVTASPDSVFVFRHNGWRLPGWPVFHDNHNGSTTPGSPVIADLDRDGSQDVAIGSSTRKVEAWRADGSVMRGFPLSAGEEFCGTAVTDLDGDGRWEILAASMAGHLCVWEVAGGSGPGAPPHWPGANHDPWNTRTWETDIGGVGVEPPPAAELPRAFALSAAWPNPFNAFVRVSFDLPEPARVRLAIYNLLGQEVARLADGDRSAGSHALAWQGGERPLASGVYLLHLEARGRSSAVNFTACRKLVLLK
jgi:hypothetical protein